MTMSVARILALAAALLGVAAVPALADCFHNGAAVAEGTQVGGLVCRGGQWVGG